MSKGNKEAKKPKQVHAPAPVVPVVPVAGGSATGRPGQGPRPGKH